MTPPTATPAGDSREEGHPGNGPYCDDSGELARSIDGFPQTWSSGDGCWQGRGGGGGRSPVPRKRMGRSACGSALQDRCAEQLGQERDGQVYVTNNSNVHEKGRGDGNGEEWWWGREGSWDDDAILEEWDSVKLDGGFVEIHETEFFPAQEEGEALDPEGQLLMWDRHVLLRDLRRDVYEVPVELDADCRQFVAWHGERLQHVMVVARVQMLVGVQCYGPSVLCRGC